MKLGVISDTHIPDRARRLHPEILPFFKEARVDAILHAGDVSSPGVLQQLDELAPVYAVRGNRDWLLLGRLPLVQELTFEGVSFVLTHGHGRWRDYLVDKANYFLNGLQPERYQNRLLAAFPAARVIVFGHVHRPLNLWVGRQLLFNPGSPHFPDRDSHALSIGLIGITAEGEVKGEIIRLDHSQL
jgi:putative phosphoesterase